VAYDGQTVVDGDGAFILAVDESGAFVGADVFGTPAASVDPRTLAVSLGGRVFVGGSAIGDGRFGSQPFIVPDTSGNGVGFLPTGGFLLEVDASAVSAP